MKHLGATAFGNINLLEDDSFAVGLTLENIELFFSSRFCYQTDYRYLSTQILESIIQKQPSRGVLQKKCSEKMQQIYRRTAMP